jgi:hypothetical protein
MPDALNEYGHLIFFWVQSLQPGGNTTFEVVFLARELGNVEDTLVIHSSAGSFKYSVSSSFFISVMLHVISSS